MKAYRERFIKNYRPEIQITQTRKGYRKALVYIGDFYTWNPPGRSIDFIRRLYLILEIITVVLFGLSSIPGSSISYSSLVMSGAILSIVAWAFEVFGVFNLCIRKLPLQEDDYSNVNKIYRCTTIIRFVCLLFSTVTGILYMAEKGFDTAGVLAVIGYFLTALIALYLFLSYLRLARYKVIIPGEGSKQN